MLNANLKVITLAIMLAVGAFTGNTGLNELTDSKMASIGADSDR